MPTTNDDALLLTVKDLIAIAMGPRQSNTVNFKELEFLLTIFATQLRCLDKEVKVSVEAHLGESGDIVTIDGETEPETELYGSRKIRSTNKYTNTSKPVGGIEVVTISEFNLLKSRLLKLQELVGPVAMPKMPGNKTLMKGIGHGEVNLSHVMNAMQVKSRISAAEEMVLRMSVILTSLAGTGAVPKEVSNLIASTVATMKSSPLFEKFKEEISDGSHTAKDVDVSKDVDDGVTSEELQESVRKLRADLMTLINAEKTNEQIAMEKSYIKSEEVKSKLNKTVNMSDRLDMLREMVNSYTSQLDGLQDGISIQVKNCKTEVLQMQNALEQGLNHFNQTIANPETLAVKELTLKYCDIVMDLESINIKHNEAVTGNQILFEELKSLKDTINLLQEQKSDRDEMLDALFDKANKSLLTGMLTQKEFDEFKTRMENNLLRIEKKVNRQNQVYKDSLRDLKEIIGTKYALGEVLHHKEEITLRIMKMEETLHCLAIAIGEPATAFMTRELSENTYCAECGHKAKMLLVPPLFHEPPLPPSRPKTEVMEININADPCSNLKYPPLPDNRSHICHRYVGGSHTMMKSVVRQQVAHEDDIGMRRLTERAPEGKSHYKPEWLQSCHKCSKASL